MPSSRESRLVEVQRLADTGMTYKSIAAQVKVHPRTIADDIAILRHRQSLHNRGNAADSPANAFEVPRAQAASPITPPVQTSGGRAWSKPLPCEIAWATTPNEAGVYKWFLAGILPTPFHWPEHLTPISRGDLIYVGRATNLRTRAKHHKLQTSSSTLRRTLASLIGFPAVWYGSSSHPRIGATHQVLLTNWMTEKLLMSFSPLRPGEDLEDVEDALQDECKAPLNKDRMTVEQIFASEIGQKWKDAAGPRP